jgi:hypothetical protein
LFGDLWLGLIEVTTPMFLTALLLLIGSGSYKAADAWSSPHRGSSPGSSRFCSAALRIRTT